MRILIVTGVRGAVGGVETYLRGLTPHLTELGHTVGIIYEHRYENAGLEPDPYTACAVEWCVDECGVLAAVAGARRWRPEVLWLHGLSSVRLEDAMLAIGPAVLFAHNHDGACATGRKSFTLPQPRPCDRVMGPACVAINYLKGCGISNPVALGLNYRRQAQRRRDFNRYRKIMVASAFMAGQLLGAGAAPHRLVVCPYPLLQPARSTLPPHPRAGSEVLMLSRLTANKGAAVLIAAMALAERALRRRLRLVVAGEGPERAGLMRQAAALHLAVDFPGWIDAAARVEYLRSADLLAVPSLWPEPFGMVGLEAAAEGVPAVGFAVGGIPEWLRGGETGELAPARPPTAEGLAAAMTRALGSREHLEQLRQGAWRNCHQFGIAQHLRQVEKVLGSACAPAGPGPAAP